MKNTYYRDLYYSVGTFIGRIITIAMFVIGFTNAEYWWLPAVAIFMPWIVQFQLILCEGLEETIRGAIEEIMKGEA